mmetsp:Transcript_28868/g.31509  ORF Transcript_28868/g.31509 Transcript_28868/m.31509 type:complete len:287 (+) Transcript_28868:92-952(+)
MIYFLIVVFYFATAVVAHPLKNVIANPKFLQHSMVLQHSALLNTMNGSFPSDPSYLIMQISSDSHCAQTSALGYASYLLNQCLTTDSSSSMFITCEGNTANITLFDGMNCAAPSLSSGIISGCMGGFSVFACGKRSPYSFGGGNYVVQSNYQTSSCTNQIANTAFFSGKCYASDENTSYKLSGLTQYSYTNSSSCSGPYTAVPLPGGCELVSDPSSQFYQSYASFSEVSTSSSSSNDDQLSGGAIAGIVIGGVVFVALIIAIIFYFTYHAAQKGSQQAMMLGEIWR